MAHHAEIRSSRASQTSTSEVGLALMAQTLTISLAKALLMEGAPLNYRRIRSPNRLAAPCRAHDQPGCRPQSRLFGRRSAPAARGSICVVICTCNAFGKALGELRSDAVARSQSSRAQTASAGAGVQRAGVVGAVCVRRVWARHSKPMGWNAQLVLGAGHCGHGEATQHHSQVQ